MAKCVMVLYPDPLDGYPPKYARESIPVIECYPDGSSLPSPSVIDFRPGELLGCVSGALGLRKFFADGGHELVVTADKEGPHSEFEHHLSDADIVISQPFWPAYLTKDRFARAPKLKLALTAGIGSDHVDLDEARARGVTVAEETYSNSISVAEHTVMQILALVRNFVPAHRWAATGGWNIADCVARAYDIEGMDVGVIAAGRIGRAVLERLRPFGVRLHYFDVHRLPAEVESDLGVTYHPDVESLAASVDVASIHSPLIAQTHHMFNDKLLKSMRRGSYIVNTARAQETDQKAIVAALESGHLAGYAGDVWYPQPPSPDHPWRTMPNNAMTPHVSGTSLSAQARYAAGTREILEDWFAGRPIRSEYLIVEGGRFAGTGAVSYQQ
ncbi:NAD-dependent formate dehydrogenase [Mycobacteroides immunogenum]|uniref:Formate dehydrogenase n=1 Tax=Mycobacteroides immunogenum TaxID=83262 RepID=A0A7V8LTX4_9MYCO|nr:NAD-dependent formate dehydrogenase [Mycobacteroides immunogenum]AMT72971.1 formate dehydrogenase [Mycobacteroides immunogenum]ANO06132.1 formate dehydrogenase [Mycobacteroides immunogenum]KIU41885.1 formate dehydrogenase [Mycobacteroides immunogenum]KPG11701.1 formate dehydrogenase [Mycobacteroides immunogenum]KPG11811.1 formate dehydrogenase [Mycobacteroides immunogenum]